MLQGKVIVVSGASGALGKVVADMAAGRGARIAEIDHVTSATSATSLDRLIIGGFDLSDAVQAHRAIETAATRFSGIDVLINIAGAFTFETITDGDSKNWETMHRLNLMTALNASRAAIPYLLKSTAARIVNIGAMGACRRVPAWAPMQPPRPACIG